MLRRVYLCLSDGVAQRGHLFAFNVAERLIVMNMFEEYRLRNRLGTFHEAWRIGFHISK